MLGLRVTFTVLFAFLCPIVADAQDRFSGDWTMTSVSMKVDVDSWGANCGSKPKAYSSNNERLVTITTIGGHLIIEKGQVRTDRCGSPNPKIQTALSRRTDRRWKRECQTAKNDPKFESGAYTLTAVNDNRLEYTATSRFAWTLKGDECLVHSTEKRVFIRVQQAPPEPSETPTLGTVQPIDTEQPPPPAQTGQCEPTGAVAKVEVLFERSSQRTDENAERCNEPGQHEIVLERHRLGRVGPM